MFLQTALTLAKCLSIQCVQKSTTQFAVVMGTRIQTHVLQKIMAGLLLIKQARVTNYRIKLKCPVKLLPSSNLTRNQ